MKEVWIMKIIARFFVIFALTLVLFPVFSGAADVPRNRTLIIAQGFDPYHLWPNGSTASTNLNCGAAIVEPVFANIRTQKRMDHFTLRGKIKVNIQWMLYCMVHNIEKIVNYATA